jgi:hypothetical protein
VPTKHVSFDDSATIAFGSITGSYADLLVLSDDADVVFIFNTTDAAILLSMPAGIISSSAAVQYKNVRMPASSSLALDCRTNNKRLCKGTIQVKYDTAPSSGEVTITVVR